ncbi:O-fucosyltransferase family protein [Zea mays]|uniref:O-fucosyltransferase family protein n=1 Tax=Zea mays TaxID=4577 RepID=A0A1D6I767_MAIZE|nr:O-fucosyltransferase family protein [Zea mays]
MGSRNRRWPRPPTWVVASADETQRQGARGNDVMDLISQLMSWFMPLIASRRGSPRPPHAARHGQRCRLHEARHGVLPQGGHRCWGQGIPRHGKITDDEINAASVTCCRIYLRSESEPDCRAENTLKLGDVIQYHECGYRILYKKRAPIHV